MTTDAKIISAELRKRGGFESTRTIIVDRDIDDLRKTMWIGLSLDFAEANAMREIIKNHFGRRAMEIDIQTNTFGLFDRIEVVYQLTAEDYAFMKMRAERYGRTTGRRVGK